MLIGKSDHTSSYAMVFFLVVISTAHTAQDATSVFEKVQGSVFVVKALDARGGPIAIGSAVLLPSGKFATNYHVVKDAVKYQVGRGDKFVIASLFAGDASKDICLLEATAITGKTAELGSAASLKVGQAVYAVGAPQGLELSISEGIVSQLRGAGPPLIQTTAAISPGSSGGGLFDSLGRLVGLTTLYVQGGQSLNFAMPVEWIADLKAGPKPSDSVKSQAEWYAKCAELDIKRNWQGMYDWCISWTKSQPNDAFAWCSLGYACSRLLKHSDAIGAFQQALIINREYAEVWHNLGGCYFTLKRYEDAIDAYKHALRIQPEYVDALNGIGRAYCAIKRYSDSLEAYQQALRIQPDQAASWYYLGLTYDQLKRFTDSIGAYRNALRYDPQDSRSWCNLGNGYSRLAQWSSAIGAYRQAVRINPEFALGWFGLGLAYSMTDDQPAALDVAKTLRRLDPELADDLLKVIFPE